MRKNTLDTTTGNINKHLITLAIPLILGNILQQFYNTIDAFVVGNYAGQNEMAAIGIGGTVMNLFLFTIVGSCTGFSVLFARYYGAKDWPAFRKQHFTVLLIGLIGTVILGSAGLLLMKSLLGIIQTPTSLYAYTTVYLKWIFISLPATFIYNLYASILRSCGDTKAALYILAISIFSNLLLDILFVVKFHWGIEGAAKATAFTQLFSSVLCVTYMLKKYKELVFHKEDCQLKKSIIKNTIHFGIVTALHQSSLYIGKIFVQSAVNSLGTDAIIAYTAATRIEGFINSFGDSGAASTSIVTSQNVGAGKKERVQQTFKNSLFLLTILGLLCSFLLFTTSSMTAGLLLGTKTSTAYFSAVGYMKTISVFYLFCFTGNTFACYFDGTGKVSLPFAGAAGHITLRVILSWLLIQRLQLNAVAVASGIGWIFANSFWGLCYMKLKKCNSMIIIGK